MSRVAARSYFPRPGARWGSALVSLTFARRVFGAAAAFFVPAERFASFAIPARDYRSCAATEPRMFLSKERRDERRYVARVELVGAHVAARGVIRAEDRALHAFGDRARTGARAEETADDAGVRVGVPAAGERLAERLDVRRSLREVAERVGERDAHEADHRLVGNDHACERVVHPAAHFVTAVR